MTFETISDGTIGVTAFVDEDDMSSDSATLVPTQQSVKAYVDSVTTELQAQDLDFQADSGGALSIDLDTETMTFTGGTGITTTGLANDVTFAIDSTVTTLTGTQTLTNKTLTSPDVNTPDIDGGTIDGTVIGGTTPAAVSATTVSATGNITVGGTVDGRDVATDGTKLDGIEAGATADQTAAEIRTLVDSATNSNVFTDADHTKLDGIEAGATADQTDAEIRAAVEAATDSNVFTDADHTKLDGIEASADVTDTANVTAAGALMDSELTSEASVKALNQGVATTDSPTFAGLTTTADVSFGDNDKAIFGAGSDLQIYHSGSGSFVDEQGTGSLYIRATNLFLRSSSGEEYLKGVENGAVTAYYDNTARLATTSTGIDVTGTVTADGLTVDGDITAQDSNPVLLLSDTSASNQSGEISHNAGTTSIKSSNTSTYGAIKLLANNGTSTVTRMEVDRFGDISFYEDTGTTAKLFWDASAESLGIGTSSPNYKLETKDGDIAVVKLEAAAGGNTVNGIRFRVNNSANTTQSATLGMVNAETVNSWGGVLTFSTKPANSTPDESVTERMRIDSSGNLLVGTTNSTHHTGSSAQGITLSKTFHGLISASRSGAQPLILNRQTSDGTIADFRKDGTTVGSLGARGGDIYLETGDTGIRMYDQSDAIIPVGSTGISRDAAIDLGISTIRFKDLYLSGGALINGSVPRVTLTDTDGTNTQGDIRQLSDAIVIKSRNGSSNGVIKFNGDNGTTESEYGRFDASGHLLVGKSATGLNTVGTELRSAGNVRFTRDGGTVLELNRKTSNGTIQAFYKDAALVGSISITGSATAYNTSSDQRLKENIVDAPSASDDIDAIQVRSFDWKADGSHQKYGMVAQELQNVAPEAVSGDADSEDMMGVDYSKLVPMMLKEIQSLRARVAQLEGAN